VRESAIEALGDMGEPAVAPITRALGKPGTRGAAALVVAKMGPVAKSSINALVAALADTNPATREQVLIALASLGKAAQTAGPAIAKVLEHDPEYHVQQSAAYALWQIGSQAGDVALITTLHSKHSSLAITSAAALAHLDPANPKTVKLILPVLVEGLKHPREAVQLEACAGLAALGRAGASAVPALNLALTDDDEQVRRAAHDAIERIQRPGDSK
jgi:HEAT repeat protein